MTTIILNKIDFRIKIVSKDEEGTLNYVVMKRETHQENIIMNIYTPNKGAPKYVKSKLKELKG